MLSPTLSGKTILIYGISRPEMLSLFTAAREAGISCRLISDTETHMSISSLISGEKDTSGQEIRLCGRYALLDGFGNNIGQAAGIINRAAPGVIKAVRTENNSSWPFYKLCQTIQAEQDTIARFRTCR